MNGVVFIPDRNKRRSDYSGAFRPYALAYCRVHGLPEPVEVDVTKSDEEKRVFIYNKLEQYEVKQGRLQTVAFFCHGWRHGIQLGFGLEHAEELGDVIGGCSTSEVVVPIYACSAARDEDVEIADDLDPDTVGGDGGFADLLRDSLCWASRLDARVMAHVTAGHTATNPWVRYFEASGNPYGGSGGFWVIRPHGPLWKQWAKWLRQGDNALLFPFLSADEIRANIGSMID